MACTVCHSLVFLYCKIDMSRVMRKPTFWFPTWCKQTRLYSYRRWLEAWNFGFRKYRDCTIYVAKTKALISFPVTAKLICVFVFTYAKCWFSHDMAHMLKFKGDYSNLGCSKFKGLICFVIWDMSLENLFWEFPTKSDINRAVQPQKMTRDLKFQI